MKCVPNSSLSSPGDDGVYFLGPEPFSGQAFGGPEHSPDYVQEYRDGLFWGHRWAWHSSGGLASACQYWRGLRHGLQHEWDAKGRLHLVAAWELGTVLWRQRRDEGGRLAEDFRLSESDDEYRILASLREGLLGHQRGHAGSDG